MSHRSSPDDILGLVLGKLEGVRKQHGYWMARCPAHEDREASLSVRPGDTQPVVLHCHAECDPAEVLARIGLTLADVSIPDGNHERGAEWTPRGPAIAVYSYTDEAGKLLFDVCRTAGKQFPQRRPDPSARSGWRWNLNGVPRVVYHLPQLRRAARGPVADRVVYIVEGEKDVHAIEAAGAAATCNPGGAGKWRPQLGKHFAGIREAVIVADRDEPGRKHAAQVAEMIAGCVGRVRIVEAAAGKDAADHLAAGHGLDDFRPQTPLVPVDGDWVRPAAASIGTKEEERTKSPGPAVPSADPAMYAGVLGDITHAASPTTEADPVGIYVSLLAGVGVIVGSGPHVQVGNTRHPLLIWPLLLGRTGSGRKGEATGTAELFLRNADADFEGYTVSGLSSGEGLIERIRDPEDEEDRGGTNDKRLLVIEPEFTSVMARSKREGSTLAAVQRQAWDGRPLTVLNRKALRACASHVAIIGHITPQEFRLRLAEADMAGGTYNRYLPVYVERLRLLPIPEGVSDEDVISLSRRLAGSIRAAKTVRRIHLDGEATRLWKDGLYSELVASDDEDGTHAEFTRRAAPYCLRVAGLHAALDGRSLIARADLDAAAALIRYSIASAMYVVDRQARDPRLDRIRRALDNAGGDGLTRTEISALFSRNLPKQVLDELLAELAASDGYEISRRATRGRPAEIYRKVVSSSFVPKDSAVSQDLGEGPAAAESSIGGWPVDSNGAEANRGPGGAA